MQVSHHAFVAYGECREGAQGAQPPALAQHTFDTSYGDDSMLLS